MQKKGKKETFVDPIAQLRAMSNPYARTETNTHTEEQPDTEASTQPNTSTAINTQEETHLVPSHESVVQTNKYPSLDTEDEMVAQIFSHPGQQTYQEPGIETFPQAFPHVEKQSSTQTYTNTSTKDPWDNLPSDIIRRQATSKGEYFEEVNEHLSSWVDAQLKHDFERLRQKLGTKRRPMKLVYALNEALRDMLRKYHYLYALAIKLERSTDDLLVEAMQDLLKKYQAGGK